MVHVERRRRKPALAATVAGGALILWAVLGFTGASVGGRPEHVDFAQRRTYSQVKRAVHEAFPGLLLRSLTGLVLILIGARLRAADQRDEPGAPDSSGDA